MQLFLILGSNIKKEENIPAAVAMLRELGDVVAISSVYETKPAGARAYPNFFNVAVQMATGLSAAAIKRQICEVVEERLLRRRQADRNAPRTIDVDIVLLGDEVLEYAGKDGRLRRVPDPDLLRFAHVAVPIAELAPSRPHPETGEPLAGIAAKLLAAANQGEAPTLWRRDDFRLPATP